MLPWISPRLAGEVHVEMPVHAPHRIDEQDHKTHGGHVELERQLLRIPGELMRMLFNQMIRVVA